MDEKKSKHLIEQNLIKYSEPIFSNDKFEYFSSNSSFNPHENFKTLVMGYAKKNDYSQRPGIDFTAMVWGPPVIPPLPKLRKKHHK